jgi:hypothetical protein
MTVTRGELERSMEEIHEHFTRCGSAGTTVVPADGEVKQGWCDRCDGKPFQATPARSAGATRSAARTALRGTGS